MHINIQRNKILLKRNIISATGCVFHPENGEKVNCIGYRENKKKEC